MKTNTLLFILALFIFFTFSCNTTNKNDKKSNKDTSTNKYETSSIQLIKKKDENRVDVMINDELFTCYLYPDTGKKPFLFPVIAPKGQMVTRGWPINPRPGERIDHPHQTGVWFTHGDVNGLDFWNNSYTISKKDQHKYGTVLHKKIVGSSNDANKAELSVKCEWIGPDSSIVLNEYSRYIFRDSANMRIIDRIINLTATNGDVLFEDNKEGLFAIRLARELESPESRPVILTDSTGKPKSKPVVDSTNVTGLYRTSEGLEGNKQAWGTRARWVTVTGKIDGEQVVVAIMDHPENIGFPAYWHTRGYGLFAPNNLGHKVYSNGMEELNYSLTAGQSVRFKYRLIVTHQDLPEEKMNKMFNEFSETEF